MSIVSGIGLTSGIDYNQLITNLMAIERRPVELLQAEQTSYNDKISAYNTLSTKLSTLEDAVNQLKSTSNFYVKTASVSDSTIIDATASNSASPGVYTIEPNSGTNDIQLASVDRRTGKTSSSSSTAVVNNSGNSQTFEYTYEGTTRTLSIADQATLEDLRDAINNDPGNPGVTASIINVADNDYRLLLTGKDTGSANTITITDNTTLTGFTDSDFTASNATDAKFRIGGVDITKSSNTITDVIPGVTFTLKAGSTSSVTITVNNDLDTIKKNIEDFVNAYNGVLSYISSNSQYDTNTHTGGPLAAESTAMEIGNRLKTIASSRVSAAPSDLGTLAQIGITTDYETGQLTIDSSTLDEKISTRLDDVATLFTDSTNGIGNQFYNYVTGLTDSVNGLITIKTNGLQSSVTRISDDISQLNDRLSRTEEDLRTRFAALEAMLTQMSSQSSYLSRLGTQIQA